MPVTSASDDPTATATLRGLRATLLGLYLLGAAGAGAELLLLGHFEDTWQLAPLALFATAMLLLAWYGFGRRALGMRAFQLVMVLHLAAGVAGGILHYRANREFELEMYPGMGGVELFQESMTGAFPALAPGAMILLGLLGLAWTYRHPALQARSPHP